jgi:L,D-transpeptidase YcbB
MLGRARLPALAVLLASPTMPGAIQTAAFAQAQPALGYEIPAQPQSAPARAPVWSRSAVVELLDYVSRIDAEGLEPAAYRPDELRAAIDSDDEGARTRLATDIFLRLSADLSGGYVRGSDRAGWHIEGAGIDGHRQQELLRRVMREGGVAPVLDALLPTHSQYVGLRRALARTPAEDRARRDLIRANMERWRWMPRDLGRRHVIVNVPAFTAAIVDEGQVIARHRAVVGKTSTPTPQLSAMITGVTFNPWWNVPQSIIPELGAMRGYDVRRSENGTLIVRQPPGPNNALGRLKIEMPNEHAIFLHDTPAQALFARDARAFSHGCIRTQNVRDFAAQLLAPTGEWDRAGIDRSIATGRTSTTELAAPVPAYVVYFTAAATNDGDIVTYSDLYGRDRPIQQALGRLGHGGTASASVG